MNILLSPQKDIEKFFGKKGLIGKTLLDMTAQKEKAFSWLLGSMDNGFDAIVGFFNEKARYIAFKKRSGTKWEEADIRGCLMTLGDFSNWSSKPGSDFFDYIERESGKPDGKVLASATGWHNPKRRYAFVYAPTVTGEIALLPARDSIDKKFPT